MQLGKAEVLIGRKGRNTRSLSRTLKYVLDILQTEKAFTVEEYKHTHTHTHTLMGYLCKSTFIPLLGLFQYGFPVF